MSNSKRTTSSIDYLRSGLRSFRMKTPKFESLIEEICGRPIRQASNKVTNLEELNRDRVL
jgi:hypothetical protein